MLFALPLLLDWSEQEQERSAERVPLEYEWAIVSAKRGGVEGYGPAQLLWARMADLKFQPAPRGRVEWATNRDANELARKKKA